MSRPGEDDLIARFFAPLATLPGADRLRDDAAVLTPPPGASFVVTSDALVAGVHFLDDDPPDLIARKALRVNLSDLAAKGATPHAFLLDLMLPGDWTEAWLDAFAAGLGADAMAFDCPLIGGDTTRTPGPLTLAVTAFGMVPSPRVPRRSGAGAGDIVYVSGTIGDGALGLLARGGRLPSLAAAVAEALIERYRLPQPRLALAPAVLACASASMDVSDGLVGDLAKLLRVSGRSGTIDLDAVPLSPATRAAIAADPALLGTAVTGGDDYEILCTVPPARVEAFAAMAAAVGVPVTAIGVVTDAASAPRFLRRDGGEMRFARGSFSHF